MSVFDHVYYPFHHDHINTPVNTPLLPSLNFRWLGVSHENWGGGWYNPPGGVWINHWSVKPLLGSTHWTVTTSTATASSTTLLVVK